MDDLPSCRTHSVTRLIQQLKNEDQQAAEQLWIRYFERLLRLARSKLKSLPNKTVDEEDVLVSVFDRFFRAANEERFARLEDRDDLWQILLMLTDRKVADEYRHSNAQKRGGGKVANEADFLDLNLAQIRELADQEPDAEFVVAFNDHFARAIRRLGDERTRDVALLKLEGHSNAEIAESLNTSLSTVERKLRVIRDLWQQEFAD